MTRTVRPDEWHADKWSHEALMDMQARMAPDDIKRISGEWKTVLSELDSLFVTFLADVTGMIGEGWSGPGAQAALSTMRDYVGNSRTALRQANTLSTGLDVLAVAASELQQKIAPPFVSALVDELGGTLGRESPIVGRWEKALNQVRTVYSGPAVQAGNAVAVLAGPQERLRFGVGTDTDLPGAVDHPAHEQAERAEEFLSRLGLIDPEPDTRPSAPHSNTGLPVQIPLAVTGTPRNSLPDGGFGSDSLAGSRTDDLGEDDVYARQDWMRDPLRRENPTRSAGFDSAAATSAVPNTALSPDRFPPENALPNASTVGSGQAPRPGGSMTPMMGMYPPHAGKRRDDENEHRSSPSLVNADNTRELLGELPRGTAPVIGLWDTDDEDDLEPPRPRGFRSR